MNKTELSSERLLSEKEVENIYGISRYTLRVHRRRNCGLPWIKLGTGNNARVRYPKTLVDKHIFKNSVICEVSDDVEK